MHLALASAGAGAGADPALIAGIAAYRRHPYQRTLPDPPVLWQDGATRLLDYAATGAKPPGRKRGKAKRGASLPVLFVPSMINRAYVLDLAPGRSLLRWLAAQGVRPLLLDWGWPEAAERRFTLSDIITGRLLPALAAIGEPVALVGYCMGGLLTLAAAQLQPAAVAGLALLATPWDFQAGPPNPGLAVLLPQLAALTAGGTLPIDALQACFALRDPGAVARKFRDFATLDQASPAAAMFVALEDWLADGIPLAAPIARECVAGWYGENTPMHRRWAVAGHIVDPATLLVPTLAAIPARDRLVPPDSARPLAALIPHATTLDLPLGHVGMVAGSQAEALLWPALLDWLRSLRAPMSV